jgi:hypothetical protein
LEVIPDGETPRDRYYNPFEHTGLFRRFIDTPTTRADILAFATEFGHLGGSIAEGIESPLDCDPDLLNRAEIYWDGAEPLRSWAVEIEEMREAVSLWQSCRESNMKALSGLIFWNDDGVSYIGPQSQFFRCSYLLIASKGRFPEPLDNYHRGDVIGPAWSALTHIVNAKLQQHAATPQLLCTQRGSVPRLTHRLVPSSLISAMWTQVLLAMTGNKEYDQCQQCDRWFEVAAERRKDAKFCSNACRFKAYRERQKQAKRLHGEGMPFKQIADRLNSDVETVKGWARL